METESASGLLHYLFTGKVTRTCFRTGFQWEKDKIQLVCFCLFNFNSFTEIPFLYHTIRPFKVYNSVVLDVNLFHILAYFE